MEDDYIEPQDADASRNEEGSKDFPEGAFDEAFDEEEGGNGFRGNRGRGNFRARGRGPPPGWMNGPPMRFRGRGYGPGGPPMRARGFFRGRGGPRGFGPNAGPGFEGNWGPMGPPPPGMMGGPPPFGPPPPGMMPPGGPMGPPPNMMGQPPPFGGPPSMPPPNMPAPELWVETKSDDGKSYYYHARTRETTWTRPQESSTVKVITQGEIEVMAATGQVPGLNVPQGMTMGGPMGGPMGVPPMGMGLPPGMMPPMGQPHNGPNVPPFMTQPPPWHKDGIKDKIEEDRSENDDMPPGESVPISQQNNTMLGFPPSSSGGPPAFAPPGFPPSGLAGGGGIGPTPGIGPGLGPPGSMVPPGGIGPPGAMGPSGGGPPGWGGTWGGGWPPPLVGQPPPKLAAPNVPEAGAATSTSKANMTKNQKTNKLDSTVGAPPPKKEPTVIPPELVTLASEWTTHRAPDGRPYYYHAGKKESVWKKPEPMKELEALQAKVAAEKGEKAENKKMGKLDDKMEVVDVDAYAEAQAAAEAERQQAAEREKEKQAAAEREKEEKERLEKEKKEKEEAEKEKEKEKEKTKQDGRMIMATAPIAGTPWCVVWTDDGRMFYHNPTTQCSDWIKPAELEGRAAVDVAIANPPLALLQLQQRKNAALAATLAATKKTANGELKRGADSDKDDSVSEFIKKVRLEDGKAFECLIGEIAMGKEAATEAEIRAARQRAVVPHEQRVRSFLAMLQEKEVSAFSTWEKELHKIVFDPRYLMLNTKDRRQVFEQYVRNRAEEERKEKKNRLQQKKAAFRTLMEEAKLHSKSSFSEFSSKYNRDERFKEIIKARERELCFNEYLAEIKKKEKEEKEKKREQVKSDFIQMLREKSIDRHARWADTKKKIDSETRYKAVDNSSLREDYFREYCRIVKEERKKEKDVKDKERDSRSKKDKKDKDREKEKEREKEKDKDNKKEKEKDKRKDKTGEQKEGGEDGEDYKPESEAKSEELRNGSVGSEDENAEKQRQKQARVQASIKEREKEVQRVLATSLRDRDKEREYHKRDEAVQHFNALMADLVRNPDLPWREAKKQLKKDHRYSLADLLSKDDKERLFGQHTNALAAKRRDKLRAVLNDMNVSCTAHWRDVRERLKTESNTPVYCSTSQMEREFRDYQRDKQSSAKTALRQLLLETRTLTHKSLANVKENPNAFTVIQDTLKIDARYLALDHISDERKTIIMNYLEELEKKGPPPPPTATEPSRRSKQ